MTNKNNRIKVTTACQNCQTRKVKCSGEIPCRYCSKTGKKCAPGKPGKKRGPPPGREVKSRNSHSRMESLYNNKDPQVQEELRNFKNTNSGYHNDKNMTKKNKRLKVTTACQNCQTRKIKCSGEIPCRHCIKTDKKCAPGKPGKKRGPPPGQEVKRNVETRRENGEFSSNSSYNYITKLSD
ncbi:hypothetical protein C1645_576923 [Glomus cerebriforme]|uniref:Zn(2)-C6 fungal-type domain-containing protein n=1 Tax=Glomus cerebriforme TaxID=658196 RepID=A0A397S4W0_9GLOM|nr:hypothetical protein C1645_576923 [Glomus cerebriforme]